MAGETIVPEPFRSSPVTYLAMTVPPKFPGCNSPCANPTAVMGVEPGVACISPVTSPVGRSILTDVRESVVHSLDILRVGMPSSG